MPRATAAALAAGMLLALACAPTAQAQGVEMLEAKQNLAEALDEIDAARLAIQGALDGSEDLGSASGRAQDAAERAISLVEESDALLALILEALYEEDLQYARENEGRNSRFIGFQTLAIGAVQEHIADGLPHLRDAAQELETLDPDVPSDAADSLARADEVLAAARVELGEEGALGAARRVSIREPICVEPVAAKPDDGRAIVLSWEPVREAGAYRVWRAAEDGDLAELAYVGPRVFEDPPAASRYVDSAVEPGATYRYVVVIGGSASLIPPCAEVEATAVPFFGSAWTAIMAAALGLGGMLVFARRRG